MDIEIPKSTWTSISAIRGGRGFRALRTIPVMLDICKDIERYCPEAIFMNYTNPMAMLCRAMQEVSKVRVTGLCHSVQGTAWVLSGWIGATLEEVNYLCAGVNHQAWYLDFKWNGKDAYPLIREAVTTRPEIYNEEQVRNEMFLHLGYYVTESSGHNSEYNWWFRKPRTHRKYCTYGTGWNPGHYAYIRDEHIKRADTWKETIKEEMQSPWTLLAALSMRRIFSTPFSGGEHYLVQWERQTSA